MPYSSDSNTPAIIDSIDNRIATLLAYIKDNNMHTILGFRGEFNATQIGYLTQELNQYNNQDAVRVELGLLTRIHLTDDRVMTMIEDIIYQNNVKEWENLSNLFNALSSRQIILEYIENINQNVDKEHARLLKNLPRSEKGQKISSNAENAFPLTLMASILAFGGISSLDLAPSTGSTAMNVFMGIALLLGPAFSLMLVQSKRIRAADLSAIEKPKLHTLLMDKCKTNKNSCEKNMARYIQRFPINKTTLALK